MVFADIREGVASYHKKYEILRYIMLGKVYL